MLPFPLPATFDPHLALDAVQAVLLLGVLVAVLLRRPVHGRDGRDGTDGQDGADGVLTTLAESATLEPAPPAPHVPDAYRRGVHLHRWVTVDEDERTRVEECSCGTRRFRPKERG